VETNHTDIVSGGQGSGVSDPTKERIIALATERFFREGFSRISVEELAGDLAISKKTLYKYFDNKDDLLSQVIQRLMSEAQGRLSQIMQTDKNSIEKLAEVASFLGQLVSRIGKPFQVDLQRHAPHLWTRVEEFRRLRLTEIFGRLIEEGVRERYVRPDINRRIFLLAYLSAVENIVHPSVLMNESFSAREALETIIRIFLTGVLTLEGWQRFDELHKS
jgi:AcrR family transcriptional regulator